MISAFFLIVSFFLACLLGSSTDEWSWGPAMLSLAVSLAAVSVILPPKSVRVRISGFVWASVALALGYMAARAWFSPVKGLAVADLMLMALCCGSFVVCALHGNWKRFVSVLMIGLGVLVAVNALVALLQFRDPAFSVLPGHRNSMEPSGFFPHRNYFANFQVVAGLWLGGLAAFGGAGLSKWLRVGTGVAALMSLASVPLSQSRGGVVALGVGVVVLMALAAYASSRRKGHSGSWLLLAAPVLIVLMAVGAFKLLNRVQSERRTGTGVEDTLSEAGRFQYAQKALEGAMNHPFFGGGSRSVSWENYQYWSHKTNGYVSADLVFAHNEPVQTIADYGLLGFLLVLVAVAGLLTIGMIRLGEEARRSGDGRAGMILGCVAAGVAMLVQCQFSFVFHLAPGAMLFGAVMGLLAAGGAQGAMADSKGRDPMRRIVHAGALFLAILMVWPGIKATKALYAISSGKSASGDSVDGVLARAYALGNAASNWGSPSLFLSLGRAWYWAAMLEENPELRAGRLDRAIQAYAEAARLHPYDPQIAVNDALALSEDGRLKEAQSEFRRAVELQHGLEAAFHARYIYGQELCRNAEKFVLRKEYGKAAKSLELAKELIEDAMRDDGRVVVEGRRLVIRISRALAEVYLKLGREDDALKVLKEAAAQPGVGGVKAHYYVALEMFRRGEKVWYARKPEEALRWFVDALAEARKTAGKYPEGVDPKTGAKLRKQIQARIQFLEGAGIQPAPKKSD